VPRTRRKNPLARAQVTRLRLFRDCPSPDPAAVLVPTDACMGVPGLPQSATGQTSLLAGLNAPAAVGRHINGYCTTSLAALLNGRSLFSRVEGRRKGRDLRQRLHAGFLEKPPRFLSVTTIARGRRACASARWRI